MIEELYDFFLSSWWRLLGSAAVNLLGSWLLLYLWSLRTQYSLKGKHVLITGGSSGIGKAVAAEALNRGAAVVTLLARNKEKLETAKNELQRLISARLPQRVHTISADVTSESVKDALEQELSGLPPVDVLVNSAGISHTTTFLETSPGDFENQLQGNVMGSVRPTQALLPGMVSRRQGRIVFISSIFGQEAQYGYSAYSASKFAVRGLAEVLDQEMRVHNVRVSISYPPATDTPMLQAEMKILLPVQEAQGELGSMFEASHVARDICRGVERGQFLITHGFYGFMLGTVTAGMSPVYHWCTAITQVFLMSPFRVLSYIYIMLFYRIVNREVKKAEKSK